MARKKGFLEIIREDMANDPETQALRREVEKLNKPVEPDRQTDRQTDRQANRQTDRQTYKQTDKPTGKPTSDQTDKPTGEPTGKSRQVTALAGNQKILFDYIIKHQPLIVTTQELADKTGVKYGSVREAVRALIRDGHIQCDIIGSGRRKAHLYKQTDKPTSDQTGKPTGKPTDKPTDLLVSKKEETSYYLSEESLNFIYPNLVRLGWTVSQSRQVLAKHEQLGLGPEETKSAMAVAEILAGDDEYIKNHIRGSPLNFFFNVVANGTIHFPADYKSPLQRACELREKQLQEQEGYRARQWWASLTEDVRAKYEEKRIGPHEQWVLHCWRTYAKGQGG